MTRKALKKLSLPKGSDSLELCRFQGDVVHQILEHIDDLRASKMRTVVLDAPTGSGKTTVQLTVAAHLLDVGQFDAVLVLTPAVDIRDAFKIGRVVVPGAGNGQPWDLDASDACIEISKHRTRWARQIREHLQDPRGGMEGGILVATHGAGVAFFKEGLPSDVDWERILVVIDEAHHVAIDYKNGNEEIDDDETPFKETWIGKLVGAAQERGATVLMATATPYRASSRETVYPDDARLVSVSYADYAEELAAPRNLHMHLVGPLDEHGMRDMFVSTENQWFGDRARYGFGAGVISEADASRLAALIVQQGTIDGVVRSKVMICVRRITGTDNVGRITRALERAWAGVRVVDGTGSDSRKFREALAEEQKVKSYAESKVDVFIVSGRGREGTNWPLCTHYYYIGIAGTVQGTIQIRGRTTRSKREYEDFPAEFRDHAWLVMFAPTMAEKLASKVREKWHAGAILAACFLHSQTVAKEFLDHVSLRIRTSTSQGFRGSYREWVRLLSRLNHALPTDVDTARAEQRIGVIEMTLLARTGTPPSVADIVAEIERDKELSPPERLAAVFLCLSSCQEQGHDVTSDLQDAVRDFVDRVLGPKRGGTKGPRNPKIIDEHLFSVFRAVASKYDDLTSMRVDGQIKVMSDIHATDIRDIAQDMRKHILPAPPYEQVLRVIVRWYKDHPMGRKIHGDLAPYFGRPEGSYTAGRLKRDLKARVWTPAQPGHISSLDDLLRELRL